MTSPATPTLIPSITVLRRELDYGDPSLSRCQAFYDNVRIFRKTFRTRKGLEGSTLRDWKSHEHQTVLTEMAEAYFCEYGTVFWPDDESHIRANKFKYSTHGTRIKTIMRQLFWRLNVQQYRNAKHKKPKTKGSLHLIPSRSTPEQLPAASRSINSESSPVAIENFASNGPSNNDALQAAPSLQKRVDFIFRAVSHHPNRQSFSLDAKGSFRSMTLAQLEEELSMHLGWFQFRYLRFVLVAPNTHAEEMVCRGREDRFDALKRHFAAFIQECIADTPCGKTLLVEIEIEPLPSADSARQRKDTRDIQFDW